MTHLPKVRTLQVAAAITKKNKRVLVARKKVGSFLEGYWEFPGGKIEHGETPEQAIERELFEELGICVSTAKLCAEISFSVIHSKTTIRLFAVSCTSNQNPTLLSDHDAYLWAQPSELSAIKLNPSNRALWQVYSSRV